jgi:hypothetical protein
LSKGKEVKKRFFGVFIILISLILTFSFLSNIFADQTGLIHGVVPTKVTAHFISEMIEKWDVGLEFWNVGKLGGEKYSKAIRTIQITQNDGAIRNGETSEGYFTGGPNGEININGSITKLQDGKTLTGSDGVSTTIDNPEAFDGWTDDSTQVIGPAIELRVTDGPFDIGGGKLSWTVKAIVTGKPTPTVEFRCEPWENMSDTDDYYTKTITADKGKISELSVTASNEIYGDKTVTMTFVNEDSGARFSDISGQVEIRPDNDPEAWSSAKLQSKLYVDYHVKTFENSTAILSFSDASTYVLKPNSEIVLSSPSVRDSALKLLWGNMMLNIKHLLKYGNLPVEMSQGVSGIKGTILALSETGTESTVKVIEGTVEFKLLDSSQSVLVNKGESVTASKKGLSEKTAFDPAEELKSWEAITGKTIETIDETQADAIKETSGSDDKNQGAATQETTDANMQKTPSQFPVSYIILIIMGVLIVLTAGAIAVVIIKRKMK